MAGVMFAPAWVFTGCTVNASFVGGPAVMLNPALVSLVRPPELPTSVYPAPLLLIERLQDVPPPLAADTGVVPESVPPPGLFPMAIAIAAVELVTVLSFASCTATWIGGAIVAPAPVFDG